MKQNLEKELEAGIEQLHQFQMFDQPKPIKQRFYLRDADTTRGFNLIGGNVEIQSEQAFTGGYVEIELDNGASATFFAEDGELKINMVNSDGKLTQQLRGVDIDDEDENEGAAADNATDNATDKCPDPCEGEWPKDFNPELDGVNYELSKAAEGRSEKECPEKNSDVKSDNPLTATLRRAKLAEIVPGRPIIVHTPMGWPRLVIVQHLEQRNGFSGFWDTTAQWFAADHSFILDNQS